MKGKTDVKRETFLFIEQLPLLADTLACITEENSTVENKTFEKHNVEMTVKNAKNEHALTFCSNLIGVC